ncbi:unnamed protein product [Calypogeia fissa]
MGSEGPAVVTDLKLSQVGETEIIVPAEPTPNGRVFLSNIDLCLVIPVETVYFYPANPNKSVDTLVTTLKEALRKVLVPYHFMTGRLKSEGPGSRRLEIDLNRAGAQFSEYRSEVRISDLGDVVQPNQLFRKLVPIKFLNVSSVLDTPLLAVQVTIFACGGYTMGFMMSHAIFDGPGAIDFFLNFTSIARGEGLLFTPTYDRTSLKARVPPIIKYEHPENFELPADVPGLEAGVSPFSLPDEMDKEYEDLEMIITHVTKTFPFSPEAIDTLKKRALEGGVIKRVSTFEVVAAHVWLARTKAVELPEVPFNLLFAVDIRNRVIPPLPKHFAGNAVYSACARGCPSEIKQYTFVEAVQVIQRAIEQVTDDYVRSSFDWGETRRGIPALFGGFFLSAWWKMPFYSIDYGWGKPIYAGPIVTPMVEFVLMLSNGKQDGGLNLVMALEPEQMELFQEYIKV